MSDQVELSKHDLPNYDFSAFLNRVKVRMMKVEEKTAGGLYIPEAMKEKEQKGADAGIVLDIGADAYVEYRDQRLKVGDVVLYARYAGSVVPGTDDRERIINDTDIYAIGARKEP